MSDSRTKGSSENRMPVIDNIREENGAEQRAFGGKKRGKRKHPKQCDIPKNGGCRAKVATVGRHTR